MIDTNALAAMLFPDVDGTIDSLKIHYPDRPEGQLVCRFAPSPTGFLHLGGVYSALINRLLAKQQGGVFMLRIEDTDQQRKVENGIVFMSHGLRDFGIEPDEGRLSPTEDRGAYGPYLQSERLDFYHIFLKHLVAAGYAYPCWMTTDEIDQVRQIQKVSKQMPGIYGNYSQWRNASMTEIEDKLAAGDPYVIRLRSPGEYGTKRVFHDAIREEVHMQEHFQDTVLLKSDGYPTYHLAHLADDYLMGTTHVIRAEEWLPSLPLHTQLFECAGLQPPVYAHLSQLLKTDNGKKRKLSKRKDLESDVKGLVAGGFARQGILEYLMTIISPDYELWQQDHPESHFSELTISLGAMNTSGALVDLVKMEQINREYLSRLSNDRLYDECLVWAQGWQQADMIRDVVDEDFVFSQEDATRFADLLTRDRDYMTAAIGIERHTPKDPKRFVRYVDVYDQLQCFDDALFAQMEYPDFEEKVSLADAQEFVRAYVDSDGLQAVWEGADDVSRDVQQERVQAWFGDLREFGQQFGFAINNKQFKEGGRKGKTGDLAMVLRVVLCKAMRTPDLYSVMRVMGEERVRERIGAFLKREK